MIRRSSTPARARRICAGLLCLGSGTLPTAANLVINPTYLDSAGETWDATRIAVVEQAISEWTSVLGAPGGQTYELDITFDFRNDGASGRLGLWTGSASGLFVGDEVLPWERTNHIISFNADRFDTGLANYIWWDPTPGDSGYDQPFVAWDALSVARHEIGHALGYTTLYVYDIGAPSEFRPWEALISDVGGEPIFDAGGLNVPLAGFTNLAHTANSGLSQDDLMNPAIPNSQRRYISDINIDMLTLAYGYEAIPEPSVVILVMGGGLLLLRRRRL